MKLKLLNLRGLLLVARSRPRRSLAAGGDCIGETLLWRVRRCMVTHFNLIRNYYSHNELLGLSIAELAHSHSVSLDQRSQALDTNQIKLHVTILQCKILTSKQFFSVVTLLESLLKQTHQSTVSYTHIKVWRFVLSVWGHWTRCVQYLILSHCGCKELMRTCLLSLL